MVLPLYFSWGVVFWLILFAVWIQLLISRSQFYGKHQMKKDVKEVIKSKVVYVKACLVIFSYVTIMFLIYTCFLFMSHKDEEAKSKLVGNPKQCD